GCMRMGRVVIRNALLTFFVYFVCFVVDSRAADPTYWQDIRPVFRKHCTACHSRRNLKEPDVSGGLALDTYAAVRKGAKRPVIQIGKSGDSVLVKLLLVNDSDKRMPLAATPLDAQSIALIRRWIDTGAKEGTREDDSAPAVTRPRTRRLRKKDVILPTNVVPPAGVLGKARPAKLELIL